MTDSPLLVWRMPEFEVDAEEALGAMMEGRERRCVKVLFQAAESPIALESKAKLQAPLDAHRNSLRGLAMCQFMCRK